MKKETTIATVITLVLYPAILVFSFVAHLFSNRSFSFFGFGLDLQVMSDGAEIGLFMKPHFFISFLIVFGISLLLACSIKLIKQKGGVS